MKRLAPIALLVIAVTAEPAFPGPDPGTPSLTRDLITATVQVAGAGIRVARHLGRASWTVVRALIRVSACGTMSPDVAQPNLLSESGSHRQVVGN